MQVYKTGFFRYREDGYAKFERRRSTDDRRLEVRKLLPPFGLPTNVFSSVFSFYHRLVSQPAGFNSAFSLHAAVWSPDQRISLRIFLDAHAAVWSPDQRASIIFSKGNIIKEHQLQLVPVCFLLHLRHKANLCLQIFIDHIPQGTVYPVAVKNGRLGIEENLVV